MLASDVANPEFVGARNPNAMLHVEFYMHEPEDGNKPWVMGKPVRMPAIPYVRILVPGDKNSMVETPVQERHKAQFPDKWLHFQMQQNGDGSDIPGWKVEDWGYLDPTQIRDLKYLRFYTVELIAGASDSQVQKLGMGGLGLREQARKAIAEKNGAAEASLLAKKDAELAEMRARLAALEAAGKPAVPVAPQPPVDNAHVAEGATPFSEADVRGELVAQYVAKHGKKPHHKLSVEKIRAALG